MSLRKKLRCPTCERQTVQTTLETREQPNGEFIRRRRKCEECRTSFRTYELIGNSPPTAFRESVQLLARVNASGLNGETAVAIHKFLKKHDKEGDK